MADSTRWRTSGTENDGDLISGVAIGESVPTTAVEGRNKEAMTIRWFLNEFMVVDRGRGERS
jgi:hypothetical protein